MNYYLQLLSKHRGALMGFAILWIMPHHIPEHTGILLLDFIQSIGYGGVDIFLFLSGFGLYFSMSKETSLKHYYKRRFARILPEFWLFVICLFLLRRNFNAAGLYEMVWQASTLGFWFWGDGKPYLFWYISCILVFYAIFPFYFKLFKKYGIKVPLIAIGFGLLLMISYALLCVCVYDNEEVGGLTILAYARIPIFFIGAIFGHWAKDGCSIVLRRSHKIIALVATIASFVALYLCEQFFLEYMRPCSLYYYPFIIITPVLCIVLALCFEKLERAAKAFTFIGSLSLELYMCHTYVYILLGHLYVHFCKPISWMIVFIISGILAYCFHLVNKKVLQRLF